MTNSHTHGYDPYLHRAGALLEARSDGTLLEMAVASSVAWDRLAQLVRQGLNSATR
jgi:hypothetical protein